MYLSMQRILSSSLLALLLAAGASGEAQAVRKMLDVFARLHQLDAQKTSGKAEPYKFEFTESEVNDYLEYALKEKPRPGMERIEVKFFDENYISTSTTVDFDQLEKWNPGVVPEPLRKMLKGRKTVDADFRLIPNGRGLALLVVEKAAFNNVRIPAAVAQKIMEVLGSRQPEKYDFSKPVTLPFGLQKVMVDRGRAHGEA